MPTACIHMSRTETDCSPLCHYKHLEASNKTDRSSLEANKELQFLASSVAELQIFLQRDSMDGKGLHGIRGKMVS